MQPIPTKAEIERPQRQMTMKDFWSPAIQDEYFVVRQPTIEANFNHNDVTTPIH